MKEPTQRGKKPKRLTLYITEDDFKEKMSERIAFPQVHLGLEERVNQIVERLPKIIITKISSMAPDGYYLETLTISFNIKGAPFGIGVEGEVQVTYKKSTPA